jgi:prephenate dehydrogenase
MTLPGDRGSLAGLRLVVIGTGLIGTSVALGARDRGARVWLSDKDVAAARLAADLGAGELLPPSGPDGPADLAVLAMPPDAVPAALAAAQERALASVYSDTASVKAPPAAQARRLGCDMHRYVPGHPLAGRERSGPAAARADLFLGRPWALCPFAETSADALEAVSSLARALGAEPALLGAEEHDRWVALVSHAPHLVASAMAARLADAPAGALTLAGQGLRDVTRIAAGDAGLWAQILTANAAPVADVLAAVAADLSSAAALLSAAASGGPDVPAAPAAPLASAASPAPAGPAASAGLAAPELVKQMAALLEGGQAGVARIPGKRGGPAQRYASLQVVIADEPGELSRLFQAAGDAAVNIEDVGIEHSPGLPVGVAELFIRPEAAPRLAEVLREHGWPVHGPAEQL